MRGWILMGVMLMSDVLAAFDPPIAKVGDFAMSIDAPQIVTQLESPIPVRIHLDNVGTQTLRGKVRLQVVDRWKVVGANPQNFELPAKGKQVIEFTVVAGKGTHNAHYPIHAFAEWDRGQREQEEKKAHAVLVVEVRTPREPKRPKEPIVRSPERGSVPLWQQGNHQVSFQVFGQPMQTMRQGWWGTDEVTGAHATLGRVDRGGAKDSIAIHPPWRKGAGAIFVDWKISLPKTNLIFLDFAFAIRDHDPQREPPSDGVTVRVWVKRVDTVKRGKGERTEGGKAKKTAQKPLFHPVAFDGGGAPIQGGNEGWKLLYERHADSKVWVPARVDLSEFAGQQITLRIEVHPGPKNDTTCDTAFIGEPYLVFGCKPPEPAEEKVDGRLKLVALTRWQMVQAADKGGLLPKDFQTRKQMVALQILAPIAKTDEEFKRANELAKQLLKRVKVSLQQKPLSLFVKPAGTQPAVWVNLHEGEFYAYTLQPPSESGWWDALGAIVFSDRELFLEGFDLRVLGDNLSDWRSPSILLSRSEKAEGNRLIATHRLEREGLPYTLAMLAWSEGGTLKIRWQLATITPQDKHQPLRITDCALRSWGEIAERIYIGHGNVIVRPQEFRLHADGHLLATRHAGMDFTNGVSVVIGVDNPPDFFECRPSTRHYSIHAHMDLTFTVAASERNVWVAAKRYREVDPYKPAPALAKLAGRFVFDLWGGWRYSWVAEGLEKAFRYGCTDALVIYHNWQRWGYDYRLPDIFPPNPQFGTLEDFVKMVKVCNLYEVLFAPHDNYIDFYPDAEGYSYRHICFTPDGNPVRAWFNEWRQAQSYRWRPDAFFPFMERNLKLIAKDIRPTAYFVDVFSSIGMFDWWTEEGEFRSVLETQKRWGEAFSFIRDVLNGAPQTSESGCDWLINWLEGATANHLRVDPDAPPGQWSVWRIRCEGAERIPWFDFAHHHKFALHGAGYSNRYQGGLPYEVAGIYSDDYICTEVLTGHPAMVSEPFGPQVVRKYWLLAELGRSLALAKMKSVEFADKDIHRQIVRWQLVSRAPSRLPSEVVVWVNRGKSDWKVNGRFLPPFGFYAVVANPPSSPQLQAAIERLPTTDGTRVIAEWALSERFAYCNARTKVLFGWMPIQLVSLEVRWLGDRRFELTLRWRAVKPTDELHHVFVHLTNPKSQRGEQIAFQGDHAPDIPTTKWKGEIVTKTVVTVPEQWGADRYGVRVGLWNPKTGYRLRLMGEVDDTLRIVAGDLVLEGEGGNVTGARLELNPKMGEMPDWLKHWNTQGKLIDFGFAITDGAFRFDRENLTLVPLPEHEPFNVTLSLDKLFKKPVRIVAVEMLDESGKAIGSLPFTQRNNEVTFKTQTGVFAYRLVRGEKSRQKLSR